MKTYILFAIVALAFILVSFKIFYKIKKANSKPKNCFTAENFDKTLSYTKWKQKTSKIGKVLINPYRVEVNEKDEIVFMKDKDRSLVFKVTRNEGIVILITEPRKNLTDKANKAFCELLERALFHPVNP
jgi:hypothetical protein